MIYDDNTKFYYTLKEEDYREYTWKNIIYNPDLERYYPIMPQENPGFQEVYHLAEYILTPIRNGGEAIEIISTKKEKMNVNNWWFKFEWSITVGSTTDHWIQLQIVYSYRKDPIRYFEQIYNSLRIQYKGYDEFVTLIDSDEINLMNYAPDTIPWGRDTFTFWFSAAPNSHDEYLVHESHTAIVQYVFWV